MPQTITCRNEIRMTGKVASIADGYYGEHYHVMLSLVTITRFQKINGNYETQTNTHKCILWQRHNKNDLRMIECGDIISITGELKNQAVSMGYGFKREKMIFVYDFEIQGHAEDEIAAEQTKAITYREDV